MKITLILTLLLFTNAKLAIADAYGYAEKRVLRIESKNYIVIHVHDWSAATRNARYNMITTHQNPFTPENNYAYIKCTEKLTGKVVFKKPCPALTMIEMPEDERYIVGLSDVKLWNPYQLVVFSTRGDLIKKQGFAMEEGMSTAAELREYQQISANFSESVTNWIYWFYAADPKIQFHYKGATLEAISLLDPKQKRIRIKVK